jgi:hypothetical protein
LALARGLNPEKPGSSLILVTRGDFVNPPEPELARITAGVSKQKKTDQLILETSEKVGPKNVRAADFLVGLNPVTPTAIIFSIGLSSS